MPNLVELMKRAALEAVDASMPAGFFYGTVVNEKPLQIAIDQKLILAEANLLLTASVRDFELEAAVEHETEVAGGGSGEAAFASHKHAYVGTKKYVVKLGLKTGEKVVLLRAQGGQKFIVLDRVR